jgi:F-type H+-transporting ATPase subunit b
VRLLGRCKAFAISCFGIFCGVLLLAAPALAQDAAVAPENTTTGWIMRWVNSAIVIILIAWALVKKAGPAFRARAGAIQAAIAEGARARAEAEQQRQDAERKLAGIQDEIAAMRAQAKRDAEAETLRIRELAREEAIKMDRAAELEIAAAERAAGLELKATAARLAVERAEAQLRQQLTPPADAQLVRNFAGDLAASSN